MPHAGTVRTFVLALGLAAIAACASSKSGDAIDAAPTVDAIDGMGDPCADVVCPGLTFCKEGVCVPYPACPVDGGMPGPDPLPMCGAGTVCRNDVCIPTGVDVDGDGFYAQVDCDEQNAMVHPGATETCNALDDDCSSTVDDGDPAIMCAGQLEGGVCRNGACVCPDGTFDLDPTVPGCECAATPAVGDGASCATAIDVGSMADTGVAETRVGNIPNGREVWYRFHATDNADTACDNFHVRAQFLSNPGTEFRMRAFRGACGTTLTPAGQFTTVEWFTDMRQNVGGVLAGQCPCWSGTPVDNVSTCQDDGSDYFVVVERLTGGVDTCASYNVEFSNGLYDAP